MFLKIENPGICPPQAFTVLGASTKRGEAELVYKGTKTIGTFGSGGKMAVATLLRHGLSPIIFSSNLRMEFGVRPERIEDDISETQFSRMLVKISGKDVDGKTYNRKPEDLGFVIEYGASDWVEPEMACREFVSNAIDHTIKFNSFHEKDVVNAWDGVSIEVVEDSQVRAKAGFTRIFIPLSDKVLGFYNNLGKWFLHFSADPSALQKQLLRKASRNLDGTRANAVIYKRGVRVREIHSHEAPTSLFDFNLDNLKLDESRNADDYSTRHAAAEAVGNADPMDAALVLSAVMRGEKVWESTFPSWSLSPFTACPKTVARRKECWAKAFQVVAGESGVLVSESQGDVAVRKGYKPVVVPEEMKKAFESFGLPTAEKVLTQDELNGRVITEPSTLMVEMVQEVWEKLEDLNMTAGKAPPKVKGFTGTMMDGGCVLNGYYRDGTVFFNENQFGDSHGSRQCVLEELAHYVSGSTDNSRDFQDYAFGVATKALFSRNPCLQNS